MQVQMLRAHVVHDVRLLSEHLATRTVELIETCSGSQSPQLDSDKLRRHNCGQFHEQSEKNQCARLETNSWWHHLPCRLMRVSFVTSLMMLSEKGSRSLASDIDLSFTCNASTRDKEEPPCSAISRGPMARQRLSRDWLRNSFAGIRVEFVSWGTL